MFSVFSVLLSLVGFSTIALADVVWEKADQDLPSPNRSSKQVEAHFKFKNAGSKDVRIIGVKTSCGCVVSTLERNVYQPGEQGEVVATFAYGDRVGRQEKTVVVQTDDTTQPIKVLTLRVFIPQLVQIEPGLVFWRIGDKPESKQLTVKVQAGADLGDLTATSSSPEIDARLKKGNAAGEYTLIVTPRQTAGPQTAFIRVQTGGEEPRAFIAHVRIK